MDGYDSVYDEFGCFSTAGLNLAMPQVWGVPSVEVTKVLWLAEQAHNQTGEEKTRHLTWIKHNEVWFAYK